MWNKKAGLWLKGRENLFKELSTKLLKEDKVIWMHCSSAGEFEQGKPVIEALKAAYPDHKILVSFFSPSGFAAAADYAYTDYITYLPLDTQSNAERFIKITRPVLVIFVKYEFWYHHLSTAAFHHIPILLISAVFRKEQVFFKSYGRFFRQMLFLFRYIFVQDQASLALLQQQNITHANIGGDTRFDRVIKIAESLAPISFMEDSATGRKTIVAGSTWKHDEELLRDFQLALSSEKTLLTIAPHEVNKAHLHEIAKLFPGAVYFSSADVKVRRKTTADVVVIDTVGLLSRLYRYATIAYVGGGFTKDGIHNTLEAAVWGKPVLFGPNYKKYREAKELIEAGGAFSISDAEELKKLADKLFADEQYLQATGKKAKNYVIQNSGATEKILHWIQEKRLLTN